MEILKRNIDFESIKDNRNLQISINNHGHLALRYWDSLNLKEDRLVVFTKDETMQIKKFLNRCEI